MHLAGEQAQRTCYRRRKNWFRRGDVNLCTFPSGTGSAARAAGDMASAVSQQRECGEEVS
jgi:hypothetical protein